jgi:hypothetical protein
VTPATPESSSSPTSATILSTFASSSVLLDHDERKEVGQLAQLTVARGWLEGVFLPRRDEKLERRRRGPA